MKIPYKKDRNISDLFFAIFWGAYAAFGFIIGDLNWITYLAIVCSIIYLLYFILDKKTHYLTIKNNAISKKNYLNR